MGEIADAMINGDLCEQCGDYIGNGIGIPQKCSDCKPRKKKKNKKK